MKPRLGYQALLLAAFLTACSSASMPMTATPSKDTIINRPTFTELTPSPTVVNATPLPSNPSIHLILTDTPSPVPTATLGAMQLFFPTVIPVQGAEYRPPLYPTPWALSPHDHFYFAAPIAANYPGDPISDYLYGGIFFGPDVVHTGDDIPAPRGAPVLAAGPGMVVWAGLGLFSGSKDNLKDPSAWQSPSATISVIRINNYLPCTPIWRS